VSYESCPRSNRAKCPVARVGKAVAGVGSARGRADPGLLGGTWAGSDGMDRYRIGVAVKLVEDRAGAEKGNDSA
jgi:hypothetical protein